MRLVAVVEQQPIGFLRLEPDVELLVRVVAMVAVFQAREVVNDPRLTVEHEPLAVRRGTGRDDLAGSTGRRSGCGRRSSGVAAYGCVVVICICVEKPQILKFTRSEVDNLAECMQNMQRLSPNFSWSNVIILYCKFYDDAIF